MERNTQIKDIMTKEVLTVSPDDTIENVRNKITNHSIHHMPVVEDGRVVGMISMNDIYKMEHPFTIFNNPEADDSNKQIFSTMLAKEIMTAPVVKVKEDEPVSIAVDLLLENMFHALPVVNGDSKLVGIVTTFDLIRHALEPK